MLRLSRAGRPYHGRLAFDGEDHVDPKGRKLSTDGSGNFWYKRKSDQSHLQKFHQLVTVVRATEPADLHHFNVVVGDNHEHGLHFHDDAVAPVQTSHTAAYKEQA